MQDDWRVTVTLEEHARLSFLRRLSESHTAASLQEQFEPGVVVTHGDAHIYAYAGSESTARETESLAREALASSGTDAEITLHRWHPVEQEWEPADVPLPHTPTETATEHARQQAREAAAAERTGHAEWEVLVELPSHSDAVDAAREIEALGLPLVRRWRYVVVGAATEDETSVLAERLRSGLTPEATISVRPSGGMLLEVLPPSPFLALRRLGSRRNATD